MASSDSLRTTTLFSGCSDRDLHALAALARLREFQDGELLFSFGAEANELMVISSGTVQLEMPLSVLGQERRIAFETLTPGSVVGWSSLAPGGRFTLSGRASGSTSALTFERADLSDLFDQTPSLGRQVLASALLVATLRLQRAHRMWISEVQQNLDLRYR